MAQANQRLLGGIAAAVLALAGAIVVKYEGDPVVAYLDRLPANPTPTACQGHTGPDVEVGKAYSAAQCASWRREDLVKAARGVESCVHAPMGIPQEAAYVDLAYNIGVAAFCRSSVARLANAGDRAGSCAAIELYVYAGGKKLPGLSKRRADDRAMCEGK